MTDYVYYLPLFLVIVISLVVLVWALFFLNKNNIKHPQKH